MGGGYLPNNLIINYLRTPHRVRHCTIMRTADPLPKGIALDLLTGRSFFWYWNSRKIETKLKKFDKIWEIICLHLSRSIRGDTTKVVDLGGIPQEGGEGSSDQQQLFVKKSLFVFACLSKVCQADFVCKHSIIFAKLENTLETTTTLEREGVVFDFVVCTNQNYHFYFPSPLLTCW